MTRSIYRKSTFTGLYMLWDSFSLTRFKMKSLEHRGNYIWSLQNVELQLDKLKSIFRKNGYPENVLERYATTQPPSCTRLVGLSQCPMYICLPFTVAWWQASWAVATEAGYISLPFTMAWWQAIWAVGWEAGYIWLDRISQLTCHKQSFMRRFARIASGFFKSELTEEYRRQL